MAQARGSEGSTPRDYRILGLQLEGEHVPPAWVDFGTHAGRTPEQAIEACEKKKPELRGYVEDTAVAAVPLSNWRPLKRKTVQIPKHEYLPAADFAKGEPEKEAKPDA